MKHLGQILFIIAIAMLGCKKSNNSAPPPTSPLVTTAQLTNVSGGNATAGGSIVSDGGASVTKSGVVWSKANSLPSLTDSVVASTATSGAFTVNISGIDFGNTYYFRAFATNSTGTGYGDVVTLTTSSDSVRFTYNGQSVTYGIITSPTTGKKWLDRNLGATQVATSFDDYKAYGDMFQWGRPADGHQLINWTSSTAGTGVNGMTTVLATSDVPGNSSLIIPAPGGYDWRDDNNRNRWNTLPQGPCPDGWHVPNHNEWAPEMSNTAGSGTATTGGMIDYITAYSQLKLTTPGYRIGTSDYFAAPAGAIYRAGTRGVYWSSDDYIDPGAPYPLVKVMAIGVDYADFGSFGKSWAVSVRCIKDN
ncbi:MAG TPA: FISUMP domain-containing protein [Puia sp.]|nr:FISUMP domain-containing protein [Puia sp.]